jgi:hypothetical protein
MGIGEITWTRSNTNVMYLGGPGGSYSSKEAYYLQRELEELRRKKAELDEGFHGMELGADPASEPSGRRALVDDEGILTMRERFARGEKESVYGIFAKDPNVLGSGESTIIDEFFFGRSSSPITYTDEEKRYAEQYFKERYSNVEKRFLPKEVLELLERGKYHYKTRADVIGEGKNARQIIREFYAISQEGLAKYQKGEISSEDLVSKYTIYDTRTLAYDLIAEYRRNKTISPRLNVPSF